MTAHVVKFVAPEPNVPADEEDENTLLGIFLANPDLIRRYRVPAECFWHRHNARVYDAMLRLNARDEPVHEVSVGKVMFPDAEYPHWALKDCARIMLWPRVNGELCEWYIKRLQALAYRRRMIEIDEAAVKAQQSGDAPDAIEARRAASQRETRAVLYPPETLTDPRDAMQRLIEAAITGVHKITTGYGAVDECCGELTLGMVLTVLAKAGVGKSYFASNLIVNQLRRGENAVAFASLEMSDTMTTKRLVKQYMEWDDTQFERYCASPLNRWADDTQGRYCHLAIPRTTLAKLEEQLDRWQERHARELRLLVIDFLQYIKPTAGRSLYEQTTDVTRSVKELAKRRNLLVVLLSQVRRDEKNGDEAGFKCPSIESARDSGTIEENADVLLGLWRDKGQPEKLYARGLKVREGARDRRAELRFNWATGRIAEVWQ